METIYTERANGRQEFWMYTTRCQGGGKVYLSRKRAMKLIADGCKFVNVNA